MADIASYGKWSVEMVYLWNMMILNSYVKLSKDRFSILKDPFSLIEQATFAHQVQHFGEIILLMKSVESSQWTKKWLTKCSCELTLNTFACASDFFFGFIFPYDIWYMCFFKYPMKNIYIYINMWTVNTTRQNPATIHLIMRKSNFTTCRNERKQYLSAVLFTSWACFVQSSISFNYWNSCGSSTSRLKQSVASQYGYQPELRLVSIPNEDAILWNILDVSGSTLVTYVFFFKPTGRWSTSHVNPTVPVFFHHGPGLVARCRGSRGSRGPFGRNLPGARR